METLRKETGDREKEGNVEEDKISSVLFYVNIYAYIYIRIDKGTDERGEEGKQRADKGPTMSKVQ